MSKTSIQFEEISFDKAQIAQHETAEAFIEAMSDKTHAATLEGPNREEKLRELYEQVKPSPKVEAKAEEPKAKAEKDKK